jgi:glutamine synthetase
MTRIELRMADPSCNPYLAFAVMLRAGLDGIDQQMDPGPPVNKNIYKMSHRERRHLRIDELPGNLSEALDELEKSTLMRETLGDHIFNHFLAAKREEWAATSDTSRRGKSSDTSTRIREPRRTHCPLAAPPLTTGEDDRGPATARACEKPAL